MGLNDEDNNDCNFPPHLVSPDPISLDTEKSAESQLEETSVTEAIISDSNQSGTGHPDLKANEIDSCGDVKKAVADEWCGVEASNGSSGSLQQKFKLTETEGDHNICGAVEHLSLTDTVQGCTKDDEPHIEDTNSSEEMAGNNDVPSLITPQEVPDM